MDIELDKSQWDAIENLRNGSILCGGVGSGKSRTAIAYYFKECGGSLTGTLRGFEDDYVRMSDPVDLYVITTAKKRDDMEWEKECLPFLITPTPVYYSTRLIVDSWNNIEKYVNVKNAFFIFDEQRASGTGPWAKSFIRICRQNKWIMLSATPGDKWEDYAAVFVANGFYKSISEYKHKHVLTTYRRNYPEVLGYMHEGYLQKLRRSILVDIDWKNPTTRHYETIHTFYDRSLYKRVFKDRWNVYTNLPIENVSELGLTLRKVLNSDPSRSDIVKEICDAHEKVIIFYNFDYELELLKNIDYVDGTKIAEWNGHHHEPIPKAKRWVYLVQYTAGAEGWNCIETDTMIFYSQNYSYRVMEQASGRIDRRNTKFRDLYYYILRSDSPMDIAIARTLKQKKNFNDSRFFH